MVSRDSQNPNEQNAFKNNKGEVITVDGIWHCHETCQWQHFINAIEDPPVIYLDSVVTDKGTYAVSGTIDTVDGFILGLKGRLDDYLLASNTLKVSTNYGFPEQLEWPEEIGYKDNWFEIDSIWERTYYGENHIEITSKNIAGDPPDIKTYEIIALGGPLVNIMSSSIVFSVSRESEKCVFV